jgi:N-6 DNA Methylase
MARTQKDHRFAAVRVEGGILPPEYLQIINTLAAKNQSNADYGLTKSLNIKDEIGRYWRMASDLWADYKARRIRSDLDPVSVAVKEWINPLLENILGYHDIVASTPATIGNRRFPIHHKACGGAVPLVVTGHSFELDRADPRFGDDGRKRPPQGLLQEYLNAQDAALWGIVSNGRLIRLTRENPSLTRPAFIEADLERMFEEQLFSDFAAFWLIFHVSRLVPHDGNPAACVLEGWRTESIETGERAREKLREGVTDALRQFGNGFLEHSANEALRKTLSEGHLTEIAYFQQLLRLVYRLLFLFTVEDRSLLFHPTASDFGRSLYIEGYSISRLRDRALKRRHYDQHADLWGGLRVTVAGLAQGATPLGLPALGGLFAGDQCPDLDASLITNDRLLKAIRALAFFESGKALARVNYRDMGTEELGSVYESLLELHPIVEVAPWRFGFVGDRREAATSGSERKLSGSYYTSPPLVNELIRTALVPIVERTLRETPTNPRDALLKLKIVDPACGSGHFLLAAARHLAAEVARLEAGPDAPGEQLRQHALREVVQHCIYGVDRNPLAVELCKTALWIETIEPGKPLTFLDAHIRCGDSIIGVLDSNIMSNGIPDEAYTHLTGDDKAVCKDLKNRNRSSPIGTIQGGLFD